MGTANRSLSALIQGFKSSATKRIGRLLRMNSSAVWQRNYYERVLRNDRELDMAREYVRDNPRKWGEDKNNPHAHASHPTRPVFQQQPPFAPT